MSLERTNPIKQEKIRKRLELLRRGINPYPHEWKKKGWGCKRTGSVQIKKQFSYISAGESQKGLVYISGRLMRKRPMGKAAFFNIQDEGGEIQCYIRRDDFSKTAQVAASTNIEGVFSKEKNDSGKELDDQNPEDVKIPNENTSDKSNLANENNSMTPWDLWKLCDIGDIVALSGLIFKTKKGELSLKVQDLKILCKTLEALPEKYHGLEEKELKYRYRHLDLIMNQKSREIFKTRSKIIYEIRKFMDKRGFMEVETPILQSMYGGAVATPFETYFRQLSQKMFLKISPEIYLKKLIVGGFEKIFEIGKNFRNEGIDRSHNPEFTMLEYYQAYTDYKNQMNQFEDLICHVAKKIKGSLKFEYQGKELDLNSWKKISLQEAVKEYNQVHKMSFKNLLDCVLDLYPEGDFKKFENALETKAPPPPSQSEDLKNELILTVKDYSKASQPIDPNQMRFKDLLAYVQSLDPQADLEKFENFSKKIKFSLSQEEDLKDELILMAFELTAEKELWNPTFVMDFPLVVSPLAKKHRNKKLPRIVERFEPYMAGMEIGNAYTELNDPVDQRQRLERQKRWSENLRKEPEKQAPEENFNRSEKASDDSDLPQMKKPGMDMDLIHPIDKNFLHALEVGMPPTGGVGLGIERLVMILTDQSHIKDSMLFPALKNKP